jgi:hypothetical protein
MIATSAARRIQAPRSFKALDDRQQKIYECLIQAGYAGELAALQQKHNFGALKLARAAVEASVKATLA